MSSFEEDVKKAFDQYNDRWSNLVKFLIDEVLTGRQSEKLIDAIDPTIKDKALKHLESIIAKNKKDQSEVIKKVKE
jgi:hypothetical protein